MSTNLGPLLPPTLLDFLSGHNLPSKMGAACVLVGLMLGAGVLLLRRIFPSRTAGRPTALMEVLGRTPVSPKQSVLLLRVAGRVLVVGLGPDSMTSLAQIDDPEEIEKMLLKTLPPPAEGFRARLSGMLAPFRQTPPGSFGEGEGTSPDAMEGEVRALERRVASWRLDEDEGRI